MSTSAPRCCRRCAPRACSATASSATPKWPGASVREGRLAFAVLLPPDFSRQAVLGAEPGAGRLILYLSEGNNYAAAGLARRFAPELAHRVNETLNERRWALVFEARHGSRRDLASLRQGVDRLVDGAAAPLRRPTGPARAAAPWWPGSPPRASRPAPARRHGAARRWRRAIRRRAATARRRPALDRCTRGGRARCPGAAPGRPRAAARPRRTRGRAAAVAHG